jgi:hypothetical protein
MRRTHLSLAFSLAALSLPLAGEARADLKEAGAITVTLRAGGFVRRDDGYLTDASAFGFSTNCCATFGLEGGYELFPRFSVHASFSDAFGSGDRRRVSYRISSRAWSMHARYAFVRHVVRPNPSEQLLLQLQASLGGGIYDLREDWTDRTDDPEASAVTRSKTGAGGRVGLDASLYWQWIGAVAGYAYHYSPLSLEDRLGGRTFASGHEITVGLSARF